MKAKLQPVKAQLTHPLRNFEIQKYYQNEPKFNGVYSRNNLPKRKDGAYVLNHDEYKSIGAHLIALYVNGNNKIYFDSLGDEHIPEEIKKFKGNKNKIKKYLQNTSIRFDNVWIHFY